MVFESIVVDILNKFLGDYVENLDRSQLQIGIWGGDVSLKNLALKPSALDELNLPVKTIYGHLGKLVLKIPWKNIYTAPVEVSVENLFLLVNPIQDIVYNEEKEEKLKQELKQSLINKVEIAKKIEKEKGTTKVDDTFTEKLAAQIIKNVQVFIQNIHLRYEDRITKPEYPFSIGISLHSLKLHTTNETRDRYVLPPETSPIFYKKMVMEGLSVYWNTKSKLFSNHHANEAELIDHFLTGVGNKSHLVPDYLYILGPVNSEAKLQINSKPESMNFITPKMFLTLLLEQLNIHLSRSQYQDLIALVENFDRMNRGALYRKYRPNLQDYKGHYKEWWKFAINSIIEEDVKRKFNNWDWNMIKIHRQLCKDYHRAYRVKLTHKPTEQNKKELNELELKLDALNIILLRQKVEIEIERDGRILADQKGAKKGWFSGWFQSSQSDQAGTKDGSQEDIAKKIENIMNDDEEKQKLYKAIDYHESSTPTLYPTSFVAIRMEFALRSLLINIEDDYLSEAAPSVLCVEFTNAFVAIQQRPAAQSFSLSVQMQSFETSGLKQKDIVPQIIKSNLSSVHKDSAPFLDIYFEVNPEDDNYDQQLQITLKPLKVVYDALTVIRIMEFFTPDKDISTVKDQLQIAANTKLEEMKEKSAIRLQYAIDKSIRLDLKIDLMAPYLIIPFGGFYTNHETTLVINLGRITIQSIRRNESYQNVKKLLAGDRSRDDALKEMFSMCYDRFSVCLDDVQMLTLNAGEDWIPSSDSDIKTTVNSYILYPTSVSVDIFKCIINDDPRLPTIKVDGNLPDITIKITEKKLLEVVALIISLPLPQSITREVEEADDKDEDSFYNSTASLRQKLESFNKLQFSKLRKYSKVNDESDGKLDSLKATAITTDFINVEVNFTWKALTVYVESDNTDAPLIEASVSGVELNLVQKLYSLEMTAKLKNISLIQNYENSVIPTLSTPLNEEEGGQCLFKCKMLIAEKNSSVFDTMYNSTGIVVEVDFSKLYVVAHQEAILVTIQWVNNLQTRVMQLVSAKQSEESTTSGQKISISKQRKISISSSASVSDIRRKKLKNKSHLEVILEDQLSDMSTDKYKELTDPKSEITELKLTVKLNIIQMCLQTANRPLATMDVDGFDASIILKKSSTKIEAVLKSISIGDLNPHTMYNKVAFISEGNEAFHFYVLMNNHEHQPKDNTFDVFVDLKLSCVQCVFMNEFLLDILEFLNNFQTSKQMIMDASAAAVASAKQNVQEVYQSSMKVSLNIFADAPIIIVPRNNQSNEVFVIDFGNLSVNNKLKKLFSKFEQVALTDEIYLNLRNMKIVKTNYERSISEQLLLKPVNYTLVIKRNLSSSWFSEIPTLDIDGSFCPIHVTIRDKDYKLLMDTLKENIGAKPPPKYVPKSPSGVTIQKIVPDFELEDLGDMIEADVTIETTDAISDLASLMRFTMTVESVTIDLFSGITENSQDDGLAKFSLSFLCVKGSMENNGDLLVHAFLSDCCLDDTRACKERNKVKRYMHRKTAEEISNATLSSEWPPSLISHNDSIVSKASTSKLQESVERSMIDVNFERKKGQTHVNVRIFSFILIFNMKHIVKIQEFFTPPSEAYDRPSDNVDPSRKITEAVKGSGVDTYGSDSSLSVISCNIIVEKPDIILVENLDDINTNALILNNEAKFFVQFSNDNRMSINGMLKNLQCFTCCYNPSRRSETTALVLHPLTVDINGSTSEGMNLNLDLSISDIKVSITAGIIELLTRISSTLTSSADSKVEQDEQNLIDYSKIWQQNEVVEDYWFLKTIEEGIDVASLHPEELVFEPYRQKTDIFLIDAPCIEITLETGAGMKTVPLLALQSSFRGTVSKASDVIVLHSFITLEVGYYNSRLAMWEPIIEPSAKSSVIYPTNVTYEPWTMQLTVQMVNVDAQKKGVETERSALNESVDSFDRKLSVIDTIVRQQPEMLIYIKSEERIELTLTKTCIDVLNTLAKSFNQAVNLRSSPNLSILNDAGFTTCTLKNEFGVDVILNMNPEEVFKVLRGDIDTLNSEPVFESVSLKAGDTVNLLWKKQVIEKGNTSEAKCTCLLEKLNTVTHQHGPVIKLIVPEKNKEIILPVSKSDKRYFSLKTAATGRNSEGSSEPWALISEVDVVDGNVVSTIRSAVRIFNHFSVEMVIYCFESAKNKNDLMEVGRIAPSQHFNLPVRAVSASSGQLYFAPIGYCTSNEPFVWKHLQGDIYVSKQVRCLSRNPENKDPFFIRIFGNREDIYYENTTSYTISSIAYHIYLRPTLIFKNFLPIDIVCCLQGISVEHVLKSGQRVSVTSAEPDHSTVIIKLAGYMNKTWTCKKVIRSDVAIFSVWSFVASENTRNIVLNLGVWCTHYEDTMIFALYCPFWMLNKTGLNLSYKGVEDDGTVLKHDKDYNKPVLFSFKEKLFFSKKKACVRIGDSEWSDKLSIDAAGNAGSVICVDNNRSYQLGVHIRLTSNSLTKQIIFSPFFTILNNCSFAIEFREDKTKNVDWIKVDADSCVPFWPIVQDDKDRTLELRIYGTNEITPCFSYMIIKLYPLLLFNKFGGLIADVQVAEGGINITVSPFHPKYAPALIINDTESIIEFTEVDLPIKSLDNIKESENAAARCLQNTHLRSWQLQPQKEILFNWSCINANKPVLLVNKKTSPIDLRKDGIGEFSDESDLQQKYWISFLNGMQRVLLITSNEYIVKKIEAVGDLDNMKHELVISIEGVGFSLVDSAAKAELLYLSISSSGIIWEIKKKQGKRFKPVDSVLNVKLEKSYQNYCNMIKVKDEHVFENVEIDMGKDHNLVVNFVEEKILSPNSGNIRRTYNSGLWFEIRSSERYNQIHAKVNQLQVDNQLCDAVFPVIFSPVPPPKSIASSTDDTHGGGKPFAELSIVQRINEESNVRQFKYFKALIQEFHVKGDIGFITSLLKLLEADSVSDEDEVNQFQQDQCVCAEPLNQHISLVSRQDFYDVLHFSPLKIHISFSLAGKNPKDGTTHEGLQIVNLITQSIGVTLTDVNDVVFRLAYFERKHKFYSQSQLLSEAQAHYTGQLVKQLYVLVLGLDVLGNPFGLVTGLKQGVEDFFYEPFQGAIQGPGEFAEGVLLGVRSLFGHTVGGAAGAVGRITGAMGKGIAALTLDEEYQRKRRERLTLHQQSFAEGGRGLVMGVMEGVGGVISKPISGAREEGVEGFVKGVGKGVVGLFMRPASGVVDFASGTVDVVRRVATCSEETRRYRLPRTIKDNGLVVPYSRMEARGFKYLMDIEKGKFMKTDTYLFHILMGSEPHSNRQVLLITNNRIIYLMKTNDIFTNNIRIEWQYTWNEISINDGIGETEDGLYIRTAAGESSRPSSSGGIFGAIFKKPNKGKILLIPNEQTRQWLKKELKELVGKANRRGESIKR